MLAIKKIEEPDPANAHLEKEPLNSSHSWVVWTCAAAFYLYEMILRVSPSVMTEGLMQSFSVTSTSLGILASCYYYAYTPLQIPCGVMVDTVGTRRIITISAALCTIGTFMFAESHNLYLAQIGRFLIGAGSACAFLSTLKIAAEWFSPGRFAVMSGLTNMMGTLGGFLAGPPLAWLEYKMNGWRSAMYVLVAMGVIMTIISWIFIKDHPKGRKVHHSHDAPLWKSLKKLASNTQVWLIALYGSLMYLPISAFAELWGVPYLMKTYSIDVEVASFATTMVFIGFAIGSPLAAWISDRYKSRLLSMRLSAGLTLGLFGLILLGDILPLYAMFTILFLVGVSNGGQVLCFACIKEISSHRMSGTAVGFTNAIVMLSGIIFQPLLGRVLDLCWDGTLTPEGLPNYTESAYQMAIIAIPVSLLFGWLCLYFAKETHHEREFTVVEE